MWCDGRDEMEVAGRRRRSAVDNVIIKYSRSEVILHGGVIFWAIGTTGLLEYPSRRWGIPLNWIPTIRRHIRKNNIIGSVTLTKRREL